MAGSILFGKMTKHKPPRLPRGRTRRNVDKSPTLTRRQVEAAYAAFECDAAVINESLQVTADFALADWESFRIGEGTFETIRRPSRKRRKL